MIRRKQRERLMKLKLVITEGEEAQIKHNPAVFPGC